MDTNPPMDRSLATPSERSSGGSSNNSSGGLHVSAAISVVVFASVIGIFLLLGLYCTFRRRSSISNAGRRIVNQLRNGRSGRLVPEPANISLPIRKYTREAMGGDARGTEDCPVCLIEFEEEEEVKVVSPGCEHVFHPACIDRWLAMNNTCPVCRSEVTSEVAYWVEESEDGEGSYTQVNVESDGSERGGVEGEVAVNVENVAVSGEVEGEGEVVVNVESVVVSEEGGEGDVVVHVESEEDEEREVEMEVSLERDTMGGEVRVDVESEEVIGERNGLEGEGELEVDAMSEVEMIDDGSELRE